MKTIIFILSLFISVFAFSQSVYPIRADTVLMQKIGGNTYLKVVGKGNFSDSLWHRALLAIGDSSQLVATTKWVKQQHYGTGSGGGDSTIFALSGTRNASGDVEADMQTHDLSVVNVSNFHVRTPGYGGGLLHIENIGRITIGDFDFNERGTYVAVNDINEKISIRADSAAGYIENVRGAILSDTLNIPDVGTVIKLIDSLGSPTLFPTTGTGTATGDVTGNISTHTFLVTGTSGSYNVSLNDGTTQSSNNISAAAAEISSIANDNSSGATLDLFQSSGAIMTLLGTSTFTGGAGDTTNYVGESYVQKDWTLNHIHDSVATKQPILSPIGNWINTTFPGTSLPADWTTFSFSPTVNNGLTFGGNSGGITGGFTYNTNYTASQNYTQTVEFTLNTAPTDYPSGFFVGKRSANTSQQTQNAMWVKRVDANNWRVTPTIMYGASATQVADSTGTISMVVGDKYRIYAAYSNSNIYVRFARLNVSGQEIETAASVYKYVINAATLLQPANTGGMWIGATGTTGNYTVSYANEYHYDLTNSEVLFVGNSIGVRYDASSVQNHYSFLAMTNSNKSWANFAGGGDRLIDMNLRVNEMISFNPQYVIIEAGTNDNASDIRTQLTKLIDTLQAHSITPIFLKLFNTTAKDTVAYNVCREQGVQLVDCGRSNISVPNNAAHPTDLGMQQIAYILKSECPQVTGSTGGHELYTLRGLGDVNLGLTPSNGQLLQYNSSTGQWANATVATGLTVGTTAISSGTAGALLYENSSNILGESAAMSFDGTSTITLTGKLVLRHTASLTNVWLSGGNLNATGNQNVAILGGTAIGSGSNNIAIGSGALTTATNTDNNIAIGANALLSTGTGFRNIAVGVGAGQNTTSGAATVAVGWSALQSSQSALYSTAVGDQALKSSTGTNNMAFGPLAGFNITSGTYNIMIGSFVNAPSATGSSQLNIGNVIYGTGMYATQSSSSTPTTTGSIGIGLTTPTARFMLPAGTATANTAPFKLTTGTSLTTAEAGAFEYTTPQLFFTNGGAQRQEIPQIQQSRVSTQFDKTSSTVLANITGLTATVVAGKTYRFEADLYTTSNVAGGVQVAIAGTATATAIVYEGLTTDAGLTTQSRGTAMATAVGAVTAVTAAYIKISGTITVNAAGTLTVQFAQNASNGTASSVLVGSTFVITEML